MIDKVIKIGNRIDIQSFNPDTNEKRIYKSQVFDIMDNNEICIAMPFEGTKLIVLSLNKRYKMCFYTKNGLYECMGYVVERYKSDNRHVARISIKTGLKKIQRREYYRLEKLIDLEYRLLTEEEETLETAQDVLNKELEYERRPDYYKGVAVDVSGGGARLILDEAYPPGTHLIVHFFETIFPDRPDYYALAQVVMSERLEGQHGQGSNRMEFVLKNEQEREKLIQYVFQEDRKKRQSRKS